MEFFYTGYDITPMWFYHSDSALLFTLPRCAVASDTDTVLVTSVSMLTIVRVIQSLTEFPGFYHFALNVVLVSPNNNTLGTGMV